MPYQAAWARLNVFDDKGNASVVSRGDYIPADLDPVQVSQLATVGAIRFVDTQLPVLENIPAMMVSAPFESESEPDDPDQEVVGFVDTSQGVPSGSPVSGEDPNTTPLLGLRGTDGPEDDESGDKVPAKYASKPEWEAYAVSKGASPEEAEASTKNDLIAKYGG
jgi:hypothetical protein